MACGRLSGRRRWGREGVKRQIPFYIGSRYEKYTGTRAVIFLPSTATLPLSGQSCPVSCRGLSNEPNCCYTWGGGRGVAKTNTTTREKQQTANQRSNVMCADLAFQPINECGTVNRSASDTRPVQWPDQGRSGPPCRPVVSLRLPSFLLVSRRFSCVPHQICVERRLWDAAVLKSRSDPCRNVSETGTTTREG